MTKNIVIKASKNKNALAVLKEFSGKVKSAGIIPKVKGDRYTERKMSSFKTKKEALRKIAKTIVKDRAEKLGKKL